MIRFNVPDMTCGACANRIGRALAQAALPADLLVEIDVAGRQVRLPRASQEEVVRAVRDAISRAGYTAEPAPENLATASAPQAGGCCCAARRARNIDTDHTAPVKTAACCG